jgi:hypothetical protein
VIAMIRTLKALLALCALVALGLGLRWVTAGSIAAASTHDLTSMASLPVGAVAWVAYTWLVLAVLATALEQLPGALGRAAAAVTTRITSQTSRTLLRSALGVAAVTPLTIGVAHATPEAPHHNSWPTTEPASTVAVTTPYAAARLLGQPWRSVEPPSTVTLAAPNHAQPQAPSAPRESPARPDTPANWRSPEQPSALRLTETPPRTPTPGNAAVRRDSSADWRSPERTSTLRLTETPPRTPTAGPTRVAVPTPLRPDRPESNRPSARLSQERADQDERPPGRVGVPDRPTIGAPTRYTDLRSGQAIRPSTRVVGPGESLWSIAATELGPNATDTQIATRWPDWYAANRTLIGPDPNLIRPGQVLRTPAPADHPVPPTHQEK